MKIGGGDPRRRSLMSVLTDAVASDHDVAEAVSFPPTLEIAVPVAPSWAALPISVSVPVPISPVPVPPIAAIPIPIHPGLCGNTPCETTGD